MNRRDFLSMRITTDTDSFEIEITDKRGNEDDMINYIFLL
jgi:hypothetical protein